MGEVKLYEEVNMVPKLRFNSFSGEWEDSTFGKELIDSRLGGNYSNSDMENENPLIKMGNLDRGYFKINKLQYISKEETLSKKDLIKYGDLFFNTRNTLELVGKVAIWKNELPKAYYNSNLMWIKFENNFFMNYILNTYNGIKGLRRLATGTTSVAAIYNRDLLNLKLCIPSILEQQKIADFLSAVDAKIQQLTRKKELLEQYKEGVMQKIFSQEVRFKDENGNAYPDWEEMKFDKALNQQIREVPKPSTKYLAIGVRSHVKGTFQKPNSDPSKITMDTLFEVKENDLIVNITFAWEGAIAIVKKEDDGGLVSHRFPTYSFNTAYLYHDYFRHVIVDRKFRKILELISPGGAGRNRVLSKKEFLKIEWSFPCVKEQIKIGGYLSTIDDKIEKVNQQLSQNQLFKKGLLQQMFV